MTNYERIKNLSLEGMAEEIKLIANWDSKEKAKANKVDNFYINYLKAKGDNIQNVPFCPCYKLGESLNSGMKCSNCGREL